MESRRNTSLIGGSSEVIRMPVLGCFRRHCGMPCGRISFPSSSACRTVVHEVYLSNSVPSSWHLIHLLMSVTDRGCAFQKTTRSFGDLFVNGRHDSILG